MNLKDICFDIWQSTNERKGLTNTFNPVFCRFIGAENPEEYCNILKTISLRYDEHSDISLIFDGSIPVDGYIVSLFSSQLDSLGNADSINESDIVGLFPQGSISLSRYVTAINYVISLADKNENYENRSIRNNFITKLIVWTFSYIKQKNLNLEGSINPKCIYYGNIGKHEIYFLIMLYKMNFDVIYLNPESKCHIWNQIDVDKLSKYKEYRYYLKIENFESKCQKGKEIREIQSAALRASERLDESFYSTGVYKPWQFRNGTTEAVFFNATVMDLETSWNEQAKVREGFAVHNDTVTVPYFFQKIEGEYSDTEKYVQLVRNCMSSKNTLVIIGNGNQYLPASMSKNEMFSLSFCLDSNDLIDPEKIKTSQYYKLGKYKDEIQNLIISKINETVSDMSMFNIEFSKEDRLAYMTMLLNLHKDIIRMIDNFDFTSYIPKVVIFLENETELDNTFMTVLCFLTRIGFDIVIFDPSGLYNPCQIIKEDRLNIIRLDEMNYSRTFSSLRISAKYPGVNKENESLSGGFLRKIFGL